MAKPGLHERWRERVGAFQASGMSVAAWCAEQGLSKDQLYYWKRKFEVAEASATQAMAEPDGWLPVTMGSEGTSSGASAMAVRIGHAVIEVQAGFDRGLFTEVAKALVALC
jgi:transposase-like protein